MKPSTWWTLAAIGMVFLFLQVADVFDFPVVFIALGLWFIWSGYRSRPGKRYRTKRGTGEIERTRSVKKKLLMDEQEHVGSVILRPEKAVRKFSETDDLELQVLQRTIEEGYEKLLQYDAIAPTIRDTEVRSEMRFVSREAHLLFEELYASPREMKKVRDFFTFYLDSLLSVTEKYAELERKGAQIQIETRNQLLENIRMIGQKLKQHQNVLLEEDTVDLERELMTIEKVLAQENEQRRQEERVKDEPF